MKIFKILSVATLFLIISLGSLNAQDLGEAIDLYNSGIKAFQESQPALAISNIEQALQVAVAIEDDEQALTLKANCEKILPQVYFSLARQQINDRLFAEALQTLNKAKELADKYDDIDVLVSVEDALPQIYTAIGTADVEAGRIEEGIAAYRKALELDKNNSSLYLRIALAQMRANDEAGAIANFDKIIAMEEAKSADVTNAQRQAVNIFLRRAQAAQAAKKWNEMYESAQKAVGYDKADMRAFRLLGASSIESKRWKDAAEAYETVLSAEPEARDKSTIIFRLATAYENLNNKAKACNFYKQLVNDAQLKAFAEHKVKELCQ
jgi:tetratricopeptide (TPR) repeat protein